MKPWRWLLQALCLVTAGTLIGLCFDFFRGQIAGGWIILAAILLLVILTCGFDSWRRLPRAARLRGRRYGLLAGLAPATGVLMAAWHAGQRRDSLLALPIILAAIAVVLLPFAVLAWQASTQLRRHCPRTDTPVPSGRQTAWVTASVAALLAVFCLGIWRPSLAAIDGARATSMRSRARGLWAAVLSDSMEREARGLPALWPRELGFTGTERSTAYFRRLLSDEAGALTEDPGRRLAASLGPWTLGGPGLPEAPSVDAFSAAHNAWQVVCVDSNAPPTYPFLISRNVDLGEWLTPTSSLRVIRSGPLNLRHVVWVTRGGGIFDATFNRMHIGLLLRPEEALPPQPYRIMCP
jgi:hypothetical protein